VVNRFILSLASTRPRDNRRICSHSAPLAINPPGST
jgi:hypothetical protein